MFRSGATVNPFAFESGGDAAEPIDPASDVASPTVESRSQTTTRRPWSAHPIRPVRLRDPAGRSYPVDHSRADWLAATGVIR